MIEIPRYRICFIHRSAVPRGEHIIAHKTLCLGPKRIQDDFLKFIYIFKALSSRSQILSVTHQVDE